ncbi:hypothetical protein FHX45_000569 [Amycolatopsis granulosa]|nr:hypothetical protein [Amycolatopsis granulosa]
MPGQDALQDAAGGGERPGLASKPWLATEDDGMAWRKR